MTKILMVALLVLGFLNFIKALKSTDKWNNECTGKLASLIVYIIVTIFVFV